MATYRQLYHQIKVSMSLEDVDCLHILGEGAAPPKDTLDGAQRHVLFLVS